MITLRRISRDRGSAAIPGTTSSSTAAVEDRSTGLRSLLWPCLAALATLVVPLALAIGITAATSRAPDLVARAAGARVVSAADLAREFGISVKLVAVTADGGLVDVRFTVTDSEKARHVLHDAAAMPELFVEATHALLQAPRPMAHKMVVLEGASYFLLYPNTGGAVQAGTGVSVVIDDVRLSPIGAVS